MESGTHVVAANEAPPPEDTDIEPCMPVGTVPLSDVGRIGGARAPVPLLSASLDGVEGTGAGASVFAASVGEDGGGEGGTGSSVGDCGLDGEGVSCAGSGVGACGLAGGGVARIWA